LGRELRDAEIRSLVTWLDSLTGTIPREYIARPELPKEQSSVGSAVQP